MSTFSLTINESDVSGNTNYTSNITDTNLLERIFPSTATTVEYTFDRSISRNVKNNVLIASFGDGYEQRVRRGINPKQEEFGVKFANRSADDVTIISSFLDNKAANNFDIVLNGETIKVTTEDYSINYSHVSHHTISTTLRRVYEP